MKLILSALFTSILVFGQSTSFYTWNLQTSPTDAALPVTTTLDGAVALANYLFRNTLTTVHFTANCTAAATTCTFDNSNAVPVGSGICFAVPCTITASATGGPPPTTFTLSSGEIALVTANVAGTLTLKRASIGTAAAITNGQYVTVLV